MGAWTRQQSGRWSLALAAGLATVALSASVALAEGGLTLEERVERLERMAEMPKQGAAYDDSGLQARLDALEAHVKNLPFGIKLGGVLVTSYLYDFNDPDSRTVSLRGFDRDDNTFSLDLAQLEVSREKGENGVGFLTKLNFGKTAERMASDWDGDGTIGNVSEEQNSVELQDAVIMYSFPGAPDFEIKAGKFVTLVGAEVIESPLNHNVSRSLAFSWAIPFTHTGVLGKYQFKDSEGEDLVSVTLGGVNGWDNVIDSNDGKSVLGQVAITPIDMFTLAVGGLYGAEQADRGDSKRGLIDVIATVTPIEDLTISLNYDYGNESDLGPLEDEGVEWQAFSGIIAYDVREVLPMPFGFAVRGEYFDDSDGTRLPRPATFVFGDPVNAYEVTATAKIELAEGLLFRTEYRYDWSTDEIYEDESDFEDSQHTIAAEFSYVF
jgi:hypothetical protein